MSQTYTATCANCETDFEVAEEFLELDSKEPGKPIVCPHCQAESQWEFDEDEADPLYLFGPEDDDESDNEADIDVEDDEEDDPDETDEGDDEEE